MQVTKKVNTGLDKAEKPENSKGENQRPQTSVNRVNNNIKLVFVEQQDQRNSNATQHIVDKHVADFFAYK